MSEPIVASTTEIVRPEQPGSDATAPLKTPGVIE